MINPTLSEMENLILIVSFLDNIMVEGEMHEVSEAEMVDVIKVAHEAIKKQCQFQLDLASKYDIFSKREYCHEDHNEEVKKIMDFSYDK